MSRHVGPAMTTRVRWHYTIPTLATTLKQFVVPPVEEIPSLSLSEFKISAHMEVLWRRPHFSPFNHNPNDAVLHSNFSWKLEYISSNNIAPRRCCGKMKYWSEMRKRLKAGNINCVETLPLLSLLFIESNICRAILSSSSPRYVSLCRIQVFITCENVLSARAYPLNAWYF